ncbi:Outer membrane protein OprM precursor [Planctomycetes bacterium Poly30]|uniref:Outer membrane protein OprM n=1 Tax=Saltatorellus ferox TaxID=2528018 RepID=A0A518EKW0_9BACT|nr:Outer membrane protein OprM precursor [Planctomycetes bacterium Poly30]
MTHPPFQCIAWAALAPFMSGCTLTARAPDAIAPELGIDVPTAWATVADSASVDARWWDGFDDATLSSLVDEALRTNHDLKGAAARLEVAAAQARVAGAVLLPTLDAGLNGQRQAQNFAALPIPGLGGGTQSVTSDSFGVSLNFRWELDLWGRLRAGARAAAADLQAESDAYVAASLSLAAQTAKAWYALTEAGLQLQLAEATVASFKETRRQATDRTAAGVQAPVDEHLSEANVASAEANLQARAEAHSRAARQLEVILGRYPSAELQNANDLERTTPAIPSGIPSEVIRRRPDVRVLERQLAAALERAGAARANLYPQLTLTGSAGTSSAEFEDLLSGDFFIWNIAGGLVQPLFAGGRLRAEVKAAESRIKVASEAFAQGVLEAFLDVEATLTAETFLAGQETALVRAADASKRAADIASNRYSQGIESLLLVLESQRRELDARSRLLSVRRARLDARIDLHLALGGGFTAETSDSTTTRSQDGASQ